ncbi:MAG: helix-turn-helix transcriptional regulator [Pseudomonadota bacterium]
MARGALRLTLEALAKKAGVHRNTISNIETGRYAGDAATMGALRNALEEAGIRFIAENGGGAGVRFSQPEGKSESRSIT